jgi:hypothetical protein
MLRFPAVTLALWIVAVGAAAQNTAPPVSPGMQGPTQPAPQAQAAQSAAAARCQVTQSRHVGLEELVKVTCAENRLSMEVWLPAREPAPWLLKDLPVTVIPVIMAPDVHVSPGRTPRSDYSRTKPVHVQIIGGPHKKVVATLVSLTFH